MTKEDILQIISFIDLTTLDNKDSEHDIRQIAQKANEGIAGQRPAAICVFPNFGALAKSVAQVPVAVVGGCFPTGQTLSSVKRNELTSIGKTGVDEVDIVINRGALISEQYELVASETKDAREILAKLKLKVILETGELNGHQIRKAAQLAIESGADFIKTSTGKISVGATIEAARIMCTEIKNHFEKTGKKVGLKVSGGIRTQEDALSYIQLVREILGPDWLTPQLFRIGASSLYDQLAIDIAST